MILHAFGLAVRAPDGVALPGARREAGTAEVEVLLADEPAVRAAFSGPCDPPRAALRGVDGRPVRYERGRDGDLLIAWEGAGVFHVDARGAVVLGWAPDGPGPAWTRFLLDSVLATTALHRGAEALHAGAVALPGDDAGAVAIAAGQGGGKTTLLGALLARGGRLVADDVSVLQPAGDDGVVVPPAPPVLNVAQQRPAGAASPEQLGEVLAELGDELWVHARDVADAPVPLRAVVHLDRRASATLRLLRPPASPIALLGHLMQSGPEPERQARRFALISDIASHVPFVVLEAPLEATPGDLAAVLLERSATGMW